MLVLEQVLAPPILELAPDHLDGIKIAAAHQGEEHPDAMAAEILQKLRVFVAAEVVHDDYRVIPALNSWD